MYNHESKEGVSLSEKKRAFMHFSKKIVEVIGVPSDLGANVQGANMGPSEIRNAQLHEKIEALSYSVIDDGDIKVPLRHQLLKKEHERKFLHNIAEVCSLLSKKVEGVLSQRRIPLVLGGDHSSAIGSISGVSSWCKKNEKKMGLIWIDAHTDINTPETTTSGNIHGMPLAVLLGEGFKQLTSIAYDGVKIEAKRTALIGIRSVDEKEKEICRKLGICIYTMREIDERGMKTIMDEVQSIIIAPSDVVHVSFDLDSVDPQYAPGVSTPVPGGLSYREAHLALEMIADTGKLSSIDMMELNPISDVNQKTAILAVEFIQSLLGKNIF